MATPARVGPDPRPGEPLPLGALLAERELGLSLLPGGPAGAAQAEVHGVHASEMADPSPYLLGGELLLTAGSWLAPAAATADAEAEATAGGTAEAVDGYVRELVRARVAALGFGVAPLHAEVPAELAAACERHGLPLLEVPRPTPFSAVARAVWRLMAEARTRELRRVTEAQRSL
ncbi:PucR family transcriptional regulator ligand-binding domain-containing protein, partial [Streptomyces bambusae]